jgi:hypothetical protein
VVGSLSSELDSISLSLSPPYGLSPPDCRFIQWRC